MVAMKTTLCVPLHGKAEQLAEARRIHVARVENRLFEVGARAEIVVTIRDHRGLRGEQGRER